MGLTFFVDPGKRVYVRRVTFSGNTRTRAQQLTGNAWAEDPGCYLSDEEIGLPAGDATASTRRTTILMKEVDHV